jgi:hypothetical protein
MSSRVPVAVLLAVSIAFVFSMTRATSADDAKVTIRVDRQYPGDRCMSGYLSVDGKQIVYVLERPWVNNINDISAIPAGTYSAHLRYDKADHWRIQLDGVPGREGVQIHVGNEPEQSKGCLLVGDKLGSDLCSLDNSRLAYQKLKQAFYGDSSADTYDPRSIQVIVAGRSSK